MFSELLNQIRVEFGSDDRHPTNLVVEEFLCGGAASVRIVFGVAEHDFKAAIDSSRLKAIDDVRKERIGDLGDNQAEGIAFALCESLCVYVWPIVEFARGFQHP